MEPGPRALINLIDGEKLLKQGQGDAIVRFDFAVSDIGQAWGTDSYLRSDKSDAFAKEIIDKVPRSKWLPAIWRGGKVYAIVSATGIFGVIDGKPRVRIFLNQEEAHLKTGNDFISPQPVFSYRDHFRGFHDPDNWRYSGIVNVKMQVDATGKLVSSNVSATPGLQGRGFMKSVEERIRLLNFLPAFEHGRPVASSTTWHIAHQGYGHNETWQSD